MPRQPRYAIVIAPEVVDHLSAIERKYHNLLRREIDDQLTHVPQSATRNRKPLEPPAPYGATWELRCGPQNRFRVFYDVDDGQRLVNVLAVGVKDRNRLFIAGEEFVP